MENSNRRISWAAAICLVVCAVPAGAAGTEAASFLDIPAGGRPAALAGAYSAMAADAYAPVYNAAGLGFLPSAQLSAMHLEYAGSGGYEYVSFVHPLGARAGLGASAQYFHAGGATARDVNGTDIGAFSSYYGAYSVAYGRVFNDGFALGAAVKLIDARIADVSARAVAGDAGVLYRVNDRVRLAVVAANLGGRLEFLQQADSLPENYRAGILFNPSPALSLAAEAAHDRAGLFSGRFGGEWRPVSALALRAGYRTDTTRELSAMAGLTTGFGLELFGQRFDYAWLPLGELGHTQYFSVVIAFGEGRAPPRPASASSAF